MSNSSRKFRRNGKYQTSRLNLGRMALTAWRYVGYGVLLFIAALVLAFVIAQPAHAQVNTTNTFNVLSFRLVAQTQTVGDMATIAQAQCQATLPCVIVFDPLLANFPVGTMPTVCPNCTWVDWRTAGSMTLSALTAKRIEGHKYADQYSTCNGSGDDRVGVQAGLNDAAGGTFHFPSGKTCNNGGGATWTIPANTTLIWDDATSKTVLTGSSNNFALFTPGGNNITFLNSQLSSTVAFNINNLNYAIFWSQKNNIVISGGSCTGFSFACFAPQDSVGVQITGVNCSNNGSMSDGSGNREGRCITITTIGTTPNKNMIISNMIIKNNGTNGIISDGSLGGGLCGYAIDGMTLENNDIEFNGDTAVQLNNAQNYVITGNTASHNGQNPITHFGEGLHSFGLSNNGSKACPDNNFVITGNTTNFNAENGIEAGFGSNNFTISGNTSTNNGSALTSTGFGIKISDIASDGIISGNQTSFNNVDGIILTPAIVSKSDGVTNGTTTFTSATAAFVAADVGKNVTIQNGNTGSAVYFGKIASRTNATTVVLSPAPTSTASGLTFWFGFYQNRITISGNHSHDNNQSGINVAGGIDISINGGESYRNGKTTANRYGVVCQQSQRCYVHGVHTFDDQAVPTQQFGVFAFASDTVSAEQVTGYGNVSGLISLTNGSSTNLSSETGTLDLMRAKSPTLLPLAFAALGTPVNGTIVFCSDCTVANPCAAAGTGALAKRLNGAWVCN